VLRERALKSQVCCSNGQERYLSRDGRVFIAHTSKSSRWEDSAHFAVRPSCNSRSDRQEGKGYLVRIFLTVGGAGGQATPGGGQTALEQRLVV
jgi:predicted heme/steroid binding protein